MTYKSEIKKCQEYPSSRSFWYNILGSILSVSWARAKKNSFLGPWWPKLETLKKQITHASIRGSCQSFGIIYMGSILSVSWARAIHKHTDRQTELLITLPDQLELDWEKIFQLIFTHVIIYLLKLARHLPLPLIIKSQQPEQLILVSQWQYWTNIG